MKYIKNFANKYLTVYTFISLLFKTGLFLALMFILDVYITFKVVLLPFYSASIILVISPAGFLKDSFKISYLMFCNVAFSFLLIVDTWYYRGSYDFLGFEDIVFKGLFNPFHRNLIKASPVDVLFLLDILVLITFILKGRIRVDRPRRLISAVIFMLCSISCIFIYHYFIDIKDVTHGEQKLFNVDWAPHMVMSNLGPLAYHLYEAEQIIGKMQLKPDLSELQDIRKWLKDNREDIEGNEFKGILKGKNVIFLQIESLENFIIGQKVYDQEITPNLNRLISKAYYFNNIFEQNNAGNSIDCDMLVNTSVFPLGNSITFLTHPEVEYNSLPLVLEKSGYYTVSTHAERGEDWNWGKAHNNALKFNQIWDISQYKLDETIGLGLSDRSYLSQFHQKLKSIPQPFHAVLSTLSSHGPFNIDQKYRKLELPKAIDGNYLGGYFQSFHYTDEQIGMFIKLLEGSGLMKNTVLVIYGDHGGVHKYYDKYIQGMPLEGDWWQQYDKRIPLIIYAEDIGAKKIEAYGGQVDIMPTMCYLLGIDDTFYRDSVMGRILVNTSRNAIVLKGNEIKVTTKDTAEYEHLKSTYDIGQKIITNNYFKGAK